MLQARRPSRVTWLLVALGLASAWGIGQPALALPPPTVTLVIDYGDGVEKRFTSIPWKPKMTVLDVMLAAREHPRGIKIEQRGRGETAFIQQIDDLRNESGTKGRAWTFRVDGKTAEKSCGIFEPGAQAVIIWRYDHFVPEKSK